MLTRTSKKKQVIERFLHVFCAALCQRSPRPPPATLPLPAVFLDIPRARKELGMLERRPETYILERAGYATSRERTAELVKIQGL